MITFTQAINDLKATAYFATGAIRAVNVGKDSKAGQAEEAARRLSASADLVTDLIGESILHTNLACEGALCLWEAMLQIKAQDTPPEWAAGMLEMWESLGSVHMRHCALDAGYLVDAVWQTMSEDERASVIPFDWGYCELFLSHMVFDMEIGGVAPIVILDMKRAILNSEAKEIAQQATPLESLKLAEEFMSGFEGDEIQEGVSEKLATIRATIARLEAGE